VIAGESFCEQPVNVSIHVQAEMSAGHFMIRGTWIYAGAPVDDFVGAGVNGTEPDVVGWWRRQGDMETRRRPAEEVPKSKMLIFS